MSPMTVSREGGAAIRTGEVSRPIGEAYVEVRQPDFSDPGPVRGGSVFDPVADVYRSDCDPDL